MSHNYQFTIFTPAYNRANTLERLYQSLLKQDHKDFEWLIVDDGSRDQTEELVTSFKKEQKLTITYFKQKNSGKHVAINKGLDLARGKWFFIVDSDDFLPKKSLTIVLEYVNKITDETVIGVVGLMENLQGEIIGNGFNNNDQIIISNLIERRNKYNIQGDLAKVIQTDFFREFKFPVIENEKFVAESLVWNRMAEKYSFLYFNEVVYVADYQEDGLSSQSIVNRRRNPKYATLLYKELTKNTKNKGLFKVKSSINYWRFAFCKKESLFKLFKNSGNMFLSVLTIWPGIILNLKDYFKTK